MKNTIFTLAVATTLIAGTIFTGCESSEQKIDDAQANVQEAKQDLKEVKQDEKAAAQQAADAEEWRTFKTESEVKIKDNELRIAELREKMKTSGKTMDAIYSKNIDVLEKRNQDLKTKIDTYDGQSNWQSFKSEFNHDMDELGKALKDIGVNNKK